MGGGKGRAGVALLGCFLCAGWVHAAELNGIVLVGVAPVDGKSVVRLPELGLRVVAVGSRIPGTDAVVRQVLPDRLVLEETTPAAGEEAAVRRTVWLFLAEGPEARSRVQVHFPSDPDPDRKLRTENHEATEPLTRSGGREPRSDGGNP